MKTTKQHEKKEKIMNDQICSEDIICTLKELGKTINPESEKWEGVCLLSSELLCVSQDTILEILDENVEDE